VILPLTVLRRLDCVLAASGFAFDDTISKLGEAGLLFQVLERFKNVELHPGAEHGKFGLCSCA
jgi:hypothetical protein